MLNEGYGVVLRDRVCCDAGSASLSDGNCINIRDKTRVATTVNNSDGFAIIRVLNQENEGLVNLFLFSTLLLKSESREEGCRDVCSVTIIAKRFLS